MVSLIVFFIVGGPFGTINDLANAAMGALSVLLAALLMTKSRWRRFAIVAAIAGAVLMAAGSALVMSEATGWYLAGLVSAVGAALIGVWVLSANVLPPYAHQLPRRTRQLGRLAGGVMLLGALAIPGVFGRVDDPAVAAWYVSAGSLSWLGTYLLYPIWCLRLAARLS